MNFSIWIEKIEDKGEDAFPTLIVDDNEGLLAVFDGLGGAGSKTYPIDEKQSYSGAYLASRHAKDVLEQLYCNEEEEEFLAILEEILKHEFKTYLENLPQKQSLLKSKLIKSLPTTLAGIYYFVNEETQLEIEAFWAGDSRSYLLTKKGLIQLSKDNLTNDPDALQSLLEDATISNCIHAEGDFNIQNAYFVADEPLVLIVASDGCFGYVESPMHFEYLLLKTLMESQYDIVDWKDKIEESLKKIAADDVSLALLAWQFDNVEQLKKHFFQRSEDIFQNYILPLKDNNETELKQELWEKYKENYYV